ncbi:MAG: energy transducer TonB [Candidatus Solibacter usitatus]|nr:energy transducer TonB [Candidatus Solibacter usitatus]
MYPPAAVQNGVSGTVRLAVVISKDGAVRDPKVVSGNPLLIGAASDAVRKWLYRPWVLDGQPIEVNSTIDVIFKLEDSAPAAGGQPVFAPPPAATMPSETSAPVTVSSQLLDGRLIRKVAPVYPPAAVQKRVSGTVRLRVVISKEGAVRDLSVESGHPLLIDAATDAVRKWVYQPWILDGQPIEINGTIDVIFKLK